MLAIQPRTPRLLAGLGATGHLVAQGNPRTTARPQAGASDAAAVPRRGGQGQ